MTHNLRDLFEKGLRRGVSPAEAAQHQTQMRDLLKTHTAEAHAKKLETPTHNPKPEPFMIITDDVYIEEEFKLSDRETKTEYLQDETL